jgi:hypothetical protein
MTDFCARFHVLAVTAHGPKTPASQVRNIGYWPISAAHDWPKSVEAVIRSLL